MSAMGMVSSCRSKVVEVNGVKSAWRYLSSGVLQGCIPAVFSMFINDLCSCIRFSKFYFYADDLQIYLSGNMNDLDEMISALNGLNEDLAAIFDSRLRMGCYLTPSSRRQF
jgi:hypothetical protein